MKRRMKAYTGIKRLACKCAALVLATWLLLHTESNLIYTQSWIVLYPPQDRKEEEGVVPCRGPSGTRILHRCTRGMLTISGRRRDDTGCA